REAPERRDGVVAVGALGDELDVVDTGEQLAETLARERLVVDDRGADHVGNRAPRGMRTRTSVPPFARPATSSRARSPYRPSSRRRVLRRPIPSCSSPGGSPPPSSRTHSESVGPSARAATSTVTVDDDAFIPWRSVFSTSGCSRK